MRILLIIFLVIVGASIQAQDKEVSSQNLNVVVPSVALLDIEGASDLKAEFRETKEAGLPILYPTGQVKAWMNYSVIKTGSATKKVVVKMDPKIEGIDIELIARADVGSGAGDIGTPTVVELSTSNQTLIRNIGSCYTGNGEGKGHELIFDISLNTAKYEKINQGNHVMILTYTIMDE